jgi:hypothetical protein
VTLLGILSVPLVIVGNYALLALKPDEKVDWIALLNIFIFVMLSHGNFFKKLGLGASNGC